MNQDPKNETPRENRDSGESKALPGSPSQAREQPVTLSGAHDVLRKFNRDTAWLVTGLMGTVVFAALVLAFQERHPKAPKGEQSRADLFLHPARAPLSGVDSSGKNSGTFASGPVTGIDHVAIPEINHGDRRANVGWLSLRQWQGSARTVRSNIPHAGYRSFVRHRFSAVKMRLIALWHQSLARSERSQTWSLFSNLSKGKSKKANAHIWGQVAGD
jgi:hypothetical protein